SAAAAPDIPAASPAAASEAEAANAAEAAKEEAAAEEKETEETAEAPHPQEAGAVPSVAEKALSGARRGSLVVVGTGISLVGQMTLEALARVKRADAVYFVVTNPATEAWIKRLKPSAVSLEDCYA